MGPAEGRARPRRTCVGCRDVVDKADLLRVVVADGMLTPDPRAQRSGRGAYLHPNLGCLDSAERRRAFRVLSAESLDPVALRTYVESMASAAQLSPTHVQEAGPTSMSVR